MPGMLHIFAYIDPGSGSLLIQALLAGLFGALLTLKLWSGRLGLLARRLCSRGRNPDGPR